VQANAGHLLLTQPASVVTNLQLQPLPQDQADLAGACLGGSGGAAELLGVPSTTLASRLRALGIRRSRRGP
jgi:hypothetical protein